MTYEVLTKNIFDVWDNKKYSMNNIEDFDLVYQKYDEVKIICLFRVDVKVYRSLKITNLWALIISYIKLL